MRDDLRYKSASILINDGHIDTWKGIFKHVPFSTVALDIGTNNSRLKRYLDDPSELKIIEVFEIAELFKVEDTVIYNFIRQVITNKKMQKGNKNSRRLT